MGANIAYIDSEIDYDIDADYDIDDEPDEDGIYTVEMTGTADFEGDMVFPAENKEDAMRAIMELNTDVKNPYGDGFYPFAVDLAFFKDRLGDVVDITDEYVDGALEEYELVELVETEEEVAVVYWLNE